jgi:hypothetical protein
MLRNVPGRDIDHELGGLAKIAGALGVLGHVTTERGLATVVKSCHNQTDPLPTARITPPNTARLRITATASPSTRHRPVGRQHFAGEIERAGDEDARRRIKIERRDGAQRRRDAGRRGGRSARGR